MLPDADRERLLHMREAVQEACACSAAIEKAEFLQSPLVQHGVQHGIDIIGEAASRVSASTRHAYPEIDWSVIRGMRNRRARVCRD